VPIVYPWRCLADGSGVSTPVFVRSGNVSKARERCDRGSN
jgi:hypothetical protein